MLYKTEDEYYNRFLVSALRSGYYKTKILDHYRPHLVVISQGPVSYEEEAIKYSAIMELHQKTMHTWEECVNIVNDVFFKRERCKSFPW